MRKLKSNTLTCYGCIYFTNSDRCNWFYYNNKGSSKPVPNNIKNMGCNKREGVESSQNWEFKYPEQIQHMINKFEGEII